MCLLQQIEEVLNFLLKPCQTNINISSAKLQGDSTNICSDPERDTRVLHHARRESCIQYAAASLQAQTVYLAAEGGVCECGYETAGS